MNHPAARLQRLPVDERGRVVLVAIPAKELAPGSGTLELGNGVAKTVAGTTASNANATRASPRAALPGGPLKVGIIARV